MFWMTERSRRNCCLHHCYDNDIPLFSEPPLSPILPHRKASPSLPWPDLLHKPPIRKSRLAPKRRSFASRPSLAPNAMSLWLPLHISIHSLRTSIRWRDSRPSTLILPRLNLLHASLSRVPRFGSVGVGNAVGERVDIPSDCFADAVDLRDAFFDGVGSFVADVRGAGVGI